jgi:hypothetical protein
MSLKKVGGVHLRKGILGGYQKFLFLGLTLMFVFISLFPSMFVSSVSAYGSICVIYTLELCVAQSRPFLLCEKASTYGGYPSLALLHSMY